MIRILLVVAAVPVLVYVLVNAAVSEEEVAFPSGALTLKGTLLKPRFGRAHPGVVLVHGSGQTSRRSMLPYAWLFAVRGYAALAYDKRGVGASDGGTDEWQRFSFENLASDAVAGLAFLAAHEDVKSHDVGFFAASQGAWVVSQALDYTSPSFIIMVSASVSTVAEDRLHGRHAQVRHAGFDDAAAEHARRLLQLDHDVTRGTRPMIELLEAWETASSTAWFAEIYKQATPEPFDDPERQWQRTVLDFDPRPALAAVSVPTLWIFGDPELDRFAPVALGISRIQKLPRFDACHETIQVQGTGHTLQIENAPVRSVLTRRIPLVLDIWDWLERRGSVELRCNGTSFKETN